MLLVRAFRLSLLSSAVGRPFIVFGFAVDASMPTVSVKFYFLLCLKSLFFIVIYTYI